MINKYLAFLAALLFALLIPTRALAVHVKADAIGLDLTTLKVASIEKEIMPNLAEDFAKQVFDTLKLPGDRVIVINSNGGSVDEGEKILHTIQAERAGGTRIVCIVTHEAHSMAFNILTQCDVRLAVAKSIMLVHKIRRISPCEGCTAKLLRQWANDLDKSDEPYRQANRKAMGLSLEDYDLLADNETIWTAKTLLTRKYLHALATYEK